MPLSVRVKGELMNIIKGDFLGFTFGDFHSSELGITRISEGNRYNENLLPIIKDDSTNIIGADGVYYFGSTYGEKTHNISFAFDELTETQFRTLRTVFGNKSVCNLIFDEVPYKVYKAKVTGTPSLNYLCFNSPENSDFRDDELDAGEKDKNYLYNFGARASGNRIYKGEGEVVFTAYSPYAKSRYKYLDEYTTENIREWGAMNSSNLNNIDHNLYEWLDSSRLVSSTAKIPGTNRKIDEFSASGIAVYNAGDLPANFILKFFFTNSFKKCIIGNNSIGEIVLEDLRLKDEDKGIQINTKLNLIEGIDINGQITGTIYNSDIASGSFFKIPLTTELILLPIYWPEGVPAGLSGSIVYDYLYY